MERSSKEVNDRHCKGGCTPFRVPPLCKILLLSLVPSFVFSQSFDVLIVEKPQRLVVYDSFQQSLSPAQRSGLQPFTPMKILKLRETLGDGITPCMKVEIEGDVFYLLSGEGGTVAGLKESGMTRTFRAKEFLLDTVEILGPARLSLRDLASTSHTPLAAGDRCIRYFTDAGLVYVKKLGPRVAYGLTELPVGREGTWWKVIREKPVQSGLSPELVQRVKARVGEANRTMAEIYATLNNETQRQIPAPQWYMGYADSSASSLTCSLRPAWTAESYKESVAALAATLQTYLLGTGYDAIVAGNQIVIKRR